MKGFRPGKTPRSVLERLYGASIGEQIEQSLVAETLGEAVEPAPLRQLVADLSEIFVAPIKPFLDGADS